MITWTNNLTSIGKTNERGCPTHRKRQQKLLFNERHDEGFTTAIPKKTFEQAPSLRPYLRCSNLVFDESSEVYFVGVSASYKAHILGANCQTVEDRQKLASL